MHTWRQNRRHLCEKRYIKHSLSFFSYLVHRRGQHSWSFPLYCHKHFKLCFCPVSFPQQGIDVALNAGSLLGVSSVFSPGRLFLLHLSFSWKYLQYDNSIQIFRAVNRQLLKILSCRCTDKWACGLVRVALGCFLPYFLPIKCLVPQ